MDIERNHIIHYAAGVAYITDKINKARPRRNRHVQQRDGDQCVKRILKTEVLGRRSWVRQRKIWINTISQDVVTFLSLTPVNAEDQEECRK